METPAGSASADLIEKALQKAHEYSFFQLVGLLERAAPGSVRIGTDGPPSREAIRFRPDLSLSFPGADVTAVTPVENPAAAGTQYLVETTFLGLYGTTTPLPPWFTEELIHESSEESLTRGVLDLLHHRLISLFYRCWEKYRYHVRYRERGEDEFSRQMLCLAGLNVKFPEAGRVIPRHRLLRYAGLLTQKPCSAGTLRAALADQFERIPVRIGEWALRWVSVPADQHNRLGGRMCTLGEDMHLGEAVKDRAGKFRIILGPMKIGDFLGLLPGERGFEALEELVRLLVSDQLEFETELVLEKEEIPDLLIQEGSSGARLGQTTWLGRPAKDEHIVVQTPRRSWSLHDSGAMSMAPSPAA